MNENKNPSVAIILVNWNGLEHTEKCIASLKHVRYTNFKVILVDNGSIPEEVKVLRQFEGIHLIENPVNIGFTGGNNIGIDFAIKEGFDIVMLLNNDTTVEPDFLDALVKAFDDPTVAAVHPKISSMHDERIFWSAGGYFSNLTGIPGTIGGGAEDRGQYDEEKEIDWVTGCCLTMRAEVIDQIGTLDNAFFILCEDVDWSLRARKAGYQLKYIPASRIYHFESASAKAKVKGKEGVRSPFRLYLNIRNHLFIIRRYVPGYYKPIAYLNQAKKILIHLAYFMVKGRWKKFRLTFKGLKDGFGPYKVIKP